MISGLFIFDLKGDTLFSKLYRSDVKPNIGEVFRIQVIASNKHDSTFEARDAKSPVITLGSTSFIYIKMERIWMCAVTRSNQDCGLIMEFLFKMKDLFKTLLVFRDQTRTLTEDVIINNFFMINELLEETVEFGFPRNLELSYLKERVGQVQGNEKSSNFKLPTSVMPGNSVSLKRNSKTLTKSIPSNVTWRSHGIKYRRNEVYLNVSEKIHVILNEESQISSAYVSGEINMVSHLSGMPLCKLGLGDDNLIINSMGEDPDAYDNKSSFILEDCKFHQCVEKTTFDTDRKIHFIPPDGEFQLMTYSSVQNIQLPFMIYADLSHQDGDLVKYKITLKSLFNSKVPSASVELKVPTPKVTENVAVSCTTGKAKYIQEESKICWKISKFLPQREQTLEATINLEKFSSSKGSKRALARPSITLDFELESFSASGLNVKFLNVEEPAKYRVIKWIKYSTSSGSFEMRC